jgi:hypothetical protein
MSAGVLPGPSWTPPDCGATSVYTSGREGAVGRKGIDQLQPSALIRVVQELDQP